tara:strand:- start:1232 stop:2191 length:960 start_codon:yes stop_codon:yes gene_type:complete
MAPLRVIFAGTPKFSASHLEAVIKSSHKIIAVYTQPDRPSGRGKKVVSSPIKSLASRENLPLCQPVSLRGQEERNKIFELKPDVIVVVAYGLILPKEILEIPQYGCVNVHASLLPKWRGAAPIERAILAGDSTSGVTIMAMDEGLDTGNMLLKAEVEIGGRHTREDLEKNLAMVGRQALIKVLDNLESYLSSSQEQDDSESSYANKLSKEEALIDWSQEASQIDRQIRAGIGRLPAYTLFKGDRVRLLSAEVAISTGRPRNIGEIIELDKESFTVACGQGDLIVSLIQLPGKKAVTIKELNNAKPNLFAKGNKFSKSVQ